MKPRPATDWSGWASAARERLDGAAQRAAAEQWSYTHFLGYLLDGELQVRTRKCVELNLKSPISPIVNDSKILTSPPSQDSIGGSSTNWPRDDS